MDIEEIRKHKGRLLGVDEILKLDGKYVYIEPPTDNNSKAKIRINEKDIYIYPINGSSDPWIISIDNPKVGTGYWLTIYEWIENKESEYTFKEVINIIQEGETYICAYDDYDIKSIKKYKNLIRLNKTNKEDILSIPDDVKFQKLKEYMTFDEAKKLGIPKHRLSEYRYGWFTPKQFVEEMDKKVWEVEK